MKKEIYACPMHQEARSDKPGNCPKCKMGLVLKSELKKGKGVSSTQESYKPLVILIGLIFLVVLAISFRDLLNNSFLWQKSLSYFMAGFFISFAGFKLLDLKGFANGYSTYDLLASRIYSYGYVYPFIELFFGLAMVVNFFPRTILWLELIVMTFSGIGVAVKLVRGEKFKCVCLGTFLKVPLTKVTLIEDFGMAFLAFLLLLFN